MLIGISGKIGSGKDLFANLLSMAVHFDTFGTEPTQKMFEDWDTQCRIMKLQGIEVHKFADALKEIVCVLTGCTRANLEDREFKESYMSDEWRYTIDDNKAATHTLAKGTTARTYREFLQELGTEVLRNWIPNIHVNATFSKWKIVHTDAQHWLGNAITMGGTPDHWPDWIITDVRFPNEATAIKQRDGLVIRINRTTSEYLKEQELRLAHASETSMDNYADYDAIIDNAGTVEELYQQALNIVKQFNLRTCQPLLK